MSTQESIKVGQMDVHSSGIGPSPVTTPMPKAPTDPTHLDVSTRIPSHSKMMRELSSEGFYLHGRRPGTESHRVCRVGAARRPARPMKHITDVAHNLRAIIDPFSANPDSRPPRGLHIPVHSS